MTILAVDNNREALQQTCSLISDLRPDAQVLCFSSSLEALAAAREKEIDLAFLSAEMPELSGLDLGQYIGELYPMVNLIFLSDSREHAYRAITMHASGYLLKPPSTEGQVAVVSRFFLQREEFTLRISTFLSL